MDVQSVQGTAKTLDQDQVKKTQKLSVSLAAVLQSSGQVVRAQKKCCPFLQDKYTWILLLGKYM